MTYDFYEETGARAALELATWSSHRESLSVIQRFPLFLINSFVVLLWKIDSRGCLWIK